MSYICGGCTQEVKRGEKGTTCFGRCKRMFHKKCAFLTDEVCHLANTSRNIKFICDACVAVFHQQDEIANKMKMIEKLIDEGVSKKIERLDKRMDELSSAVENEKSAILMTGRSTYADKIKGTTVNDPVLLIKPIKADQMSAETRKEIQEKIDPTVSGIRSVGKGGIIVGCNSSVAIDKLKPDVTKVLGDKYEVTVPIQRMPRVKIVGMSENRSEEDIVQKLRKQKAVLYNGLKQFNELPDEVRRCRNIREVIIKYRRYIK